MMFRYPVDEICEHVGEDGMVVVHPVMPYDGTCYSVYPVHEERVAEKGPEDSVDTWKLAHVDLEHI